MDLDQLSGVVREKLDEANQLLAIKNKLLGDVATAESKFEASKVRFRELEEAAVVLGVIEEGQRQELKVKIERLVSYALSTVFGKSYKFVLKMSQRGKQTDTEFLIEVPEHPGSSVPLKDAHGGGLVSVVSFLLQIIVALSTKPPLRKFIILDEPFVQVSEEYRQGLVDFVRELADKTGVQFLIISHDPELVSIGDKKYRFKLVGGVTKVEEVS